MIDVALGVGAELNFDDASSKEARERIGRDLKFVKRVERDYTEVKFKWGRKNFSYRLINHVPTVFLGQPCDNFALLTLHELGHALCKHKDYTVDIQRIKIESAAWERAKTVLLKYRDLAYDACGETLDEKLAEIVPEWDEDFVQEKVDTYRDWLHVKSKCKKCGLTGYQTEDGKYHCPRCETFVLGN